jgi:hypothetical protein
LTPSPATPAGDAFSSLWPRVSEIVYDVTADQPLSQRHAQSVTLCCSPGAPARPLSRGAVYLNVSQYPLAARRRARLAGRAARRKAGLLH